MGCNALDGFSLFGDLLFMDIYSNVRLCVNENGMPNYVLMRMRS